MGSKSFARTTSRAAGVAPRRARLAGLVVVLLSLLAVGPPRIDAQQAGAEVPQLPQRYTREGVAVEFSVEPAAHGKAAALLEGTEATVRFKITDSNAGTALSSLRPTAWMERRQPSAAPPDAGHCRQKIQSFLQASFSDRADIDLNAYFILALNHEPNISVIDPISGFGTTKLYTLVALPSPGEDWVLSADKRRLYVSMPHVNQVAVVDTASWKVLANVAAGAKPTRVALQHDGKYLWVGNDAAGEAQGGVTVIDTATLKVAAQLDTGAGHHEIAFTDDDLYAFVTNQQSGTLSVVDVRKLARVKDLKVGSQPVALSFSSLAKAVYVANAGDGTVVVVGGEGHEVLARMKGQPGLHALRFLPGGRFGFVVNRATNEVYIFDASTNRPLRAVAVGPAPDQITFTKDFAYVRSTGSEFVEMIRINELGKEGSPVSVEHFPAGQRAPRASPFTSVSASVVPAPEEGAVLVANAADQAIYYYNEGMAAPMGSFQNYRRTPRAVLVLDHSLSETAPGVYTTTVRLGPHGQYDVAFLLDSPRMVNCFQLAVKENPDLPKPKGVPINVEALAQAGPPRVGQSYQLRFKITEAGSSRPQAELKDMGVLIFLAPGIWQHRAWAKPVGGGVYEVSFVPPQPGVYYIHFQSPSLGVRFHQLPFLTLHATQEDRAPKP